MHTHTHTKHKMFLKFQSGVPELKYLTLKI